MLIFVCAPCQLCSSESDASVSLGMPELRIREELPIANVTETPGHRSCERKILMGKISHGNLDSNPFNTIQNRCSPRSNNRIFVTMQQLCLLWLPLFWGGANNTYTWTMMQNWQWRYLCSLSAVLLSQQVSWTGGRENRKSCSRK